MESMQQANLCNLISYLKVQW